MHSNAYIPKKIHYVWVGGEKKPLLIQKCIKSWYSILSDYEIIEWNESNFDINMNEYVRQAYEMKKYAFVSDYIRFYVLYHFGGIYLDTDVEVLQSLDTFLHHKGFAGFENDVCIAPGLILGAEKKSAIIKMLLDSYEGRNFIKPDGTLNTKTVVKYSTDIFKELGFIMNGRYQCINGFHIYPTDYFCPINYKTREKKITPNTYTIHHYAASWVPQKAKAKNKIRKIMINVFGVNLFNKIRNIKRLIL